MIEQTQGGFEIRCDGRACPEYLEVDSSGLELADAVWVMRQAGWRWERHGSAVDGLHYVHYCPDCQ